MSVDVNVVDSKYSSIRPLSNVPYMRGPMLYRDERTWSVCNSFGREMRDSEEGPYILRRRVGI